MVKPDNNGLLKPGVGQWTPTRAVLLGRPPPAATIPGAKLPNPEERELRPSVPPPIPLLSAVRAPAGVQCPAAAAYGAALATAAASGGTVAQTVIPRPDIARMELCP